jgi:hypothetical protein
MNGTTSWLIAAVLAFSSVVSVIVTARVTRRANAGQQDVALSSEAREWVTQAQADAKEAKTEAAAARKEAKEAVSEAHSAEMNLREVTAQTASLLRWIEGIVRVAHDPDVSDARFRQIVNGGPPELNALRDRLPE